jgi:diaminopropionate ammonia-lyase
MQADGAQTVEFAGSYEDAVARAAEHARETGAMVVSDTAWPGYGEIPRLIMLGYTRLFDEASRQWDRPPDLVLIQGGVGGLVCAAANWFAAQYGRDRPFLIACEPESAACLLESARAGRLVDLAAVNAGDGPGEPRTTDPDLGVSEPRVPAVAKTSASEPSPAEARAPSPEPRQRSTMMAGLRCAEPSPAAWPSIHFGIDAFLSIADSLAIEAMDRLKEAAQCGQASAAGPSGACGLGALLGLVQSPETGAIRNACGLSRSTRVMAVVTEAP